MRPPDNLASPYEARKDVVSPELWSTAAAGGSQQDGSEEDMDENDDPGESSQLLREALLADGELAPIVVRMSMSLTHSFDAYEKAPSPGSPSSHFDHSDPL
jgi:hypothetical protein